MKKKATYVLMLSEEFPAYHPKAGSPTGFHEAFLRGQRRELCKISHGCLGCGEYCGPVKKHTLRANAARWEHRASRVNAGEAEVSVRQWSGRPYEKGSHQIEIGRLTKLGTQRVSCFPVDRSPIALVADKNRPCVMRPVKIGRIAFGDALSEQDFVDWFRLRGSDCIFEGVILHFTDFRY